MVWRDILKRRRHTAAAGALIGRSAAWAAWRTATALAAVSPRSPPSSAGRGDRRAMLRSSVKAATPAPASAVRAARPGWPAAGSRFAAAEPGDAPRRIIGLPRSSLTLLLLDGSRIVPCVARPTGRHASSSATLTGYPSAHRGAAT